MAVGTDMEWAPHHGGGHAAGEALSWCIRWIPPPASCIGAGFRLDLLPPNMRSPPGQVSARLSSVSCLAGAS